jgi:hypothetical protein
MDEITIDKIEWVAPEYIHKERTPDWFWTIGIVALISCIIAIFMHNYLFAVFILISGACLILFTLRPPREVRFIIEQKGFMIGREKHEWRSIKGFTIKEGEPYSKLLIMTARKFLPIYTIPVPNDLLADIRHSMSEAVPLIDLEESRSMQFMEKLGF